MAVYKVIQDIEAEDKLLGPLTLKGFIYAIIAGFLAFLCVRISIASSGGGYRFIAVIILFFPMVLFGVLASPLGREQPTEVWLLSHIRFRLKPKIRLWSQLGLAELVTITAPKKVDLHLVKDISQPEVHTRLETLAMTMDSRGWALKNVLPGTSAAQPAGPVQTDSDRLVQRSFTQDSPIADIHPSEDVLDLENSPRAQHVENLLQQKAIQQKEQRFAQIDSVKRDESPAAPPKPPQKPAAAKPQVNAPVNAHTITDVAAPNQAKLQDLAKAGNDISVASVAALANHEGGPKITKIAPGEVEIKLH